jgi:hypothetical protein
VSLHRIVEQAADKTRFTKIADYIDFCKAYLEFISGGLQAVIVSQNENHYRFYQYKEDGYFNISRPINSRLMYSSDEISLIENDFLRALRSARDLPPDDTANRSLITRSIYTIQQSIGAALDALPAGAANKARKVNGDLFERFVQFLNTGGWHLLLNRNRASAGVCRWAVSVQYELST